MMTSEVVILLVLLFVTPLLFLLRGIVLGVWLAHSVDGVPLRTCLRAARDVCLWRDVRRQGSAPEGDDMGNHHGSRPSAGVELS